MGSSGDEGGCAGKAALQQVLCCRDRGETGGLVLEEQRER